MIPAPHPRAAPAVRRAVCGLAVSLLAAAFATSAQSPDPFALPSLESDALAGLENEWRAGRDLIAQSPPGCVLGLHVEARGRRIIAVKPPGLHGDIHEGEMIFAVNGLRVADGTAFGVVVDDLAADSRVRLTLEAVAGGILRDVELRCADRAAWRDKLIAGIDAALAGRYAECLAVTRELDDVAGPRVGHAKLAYECLQAERVRSRYRPGREIAAMYFDIYRRLAEPGRYSAAYRDSVRASVERAAGLLRRYGREEFALRLEALLVESR